MANTISDKIARPKAAFWRVLIAPLVAGVYYLAVKLAFGQSIISVMGRTDFFDMPHWGSNWTFRSAAEVISVGFGTFIAASLAPGRERAAAILGGSAISFGFVLKLWITFFESDQSLQVEPWYQHLIDAIMIGAAPLMGAYVAESAEDLNKTSRGVGGINRLHFLWLWFVVYFYALGLITPVARIYMPGTNIIATVITLLINAIPAAVLLIPGYYGLAFLAGHHGDTMHPAGRNMVGVIVLVFGFLVGAVIQYGWYWMFEKFYAAIFG